MTDGEWLGEREQEAWRGFVTLQMKLEGVLRRSLQQHAGLSDADYAVLVHLSEAPGGRLRIRELVSLLGWEKSRLSHHLRRMEQRGLVSRSECDSDRRGAYTVLEDTGREAIEAAAPQHVADVRRYFLDALTPQQVESLIGITKAAHANLDRLGSC